MEWQQNKDEKSARPVCLLRPRLPVAAPDCPFSMRACCLPDPRGQRGLANVICPAACCSRLPRSLPSIGRGLSFSTSLFIPTLPCIGSLPLTAAPALPSSRALFAVAGVVYSFGLKDYINEPNFVIRCARFSLQTPEIRSR